MLQFIKPEFVECNKETLTDTYGEFIIQPLERGWGITLGNALRRVLLSSIEGAAITAVRIHGVLHEFTSISGVKEDVTDIILNLKKVNLKCYSDEPQIIKLKVKGPYEVKAKDIECDSTVEIVNLDQHIATINEEGSLKMDMVVQRGKGYVPSEFNKLEDSSFIPIDAIFNPIVKVNFEVTQTRVGEFNDYDNLKIEIWTNGCIDPASALKRASELLSEHLSLFSNIVDKQKKKEKKEDAQKGKEQIVDLETILNQKIVDQSFSKRVMNALEALNIKTIRDLVRMTESDLRKGKNVGEKAISEINEFLEKLNLTLGMDV